MVKMLRILSISIMVLVGIAVVSEACLFLIHLGSGYQRYAGSRNYEDHYAFVYWKDFGHVIRYNYYKDGTENARIYTWYDIPLKDLEPNNPDFQKVRNLARKIALNNFPEYKLP